MNIVSPNRSTTKLSDVPPKTLFSHNGQLCVRKGTGSTHVGGGEMKFECFSLTSCEFLDLLGSTPVEAHPTASIHLV